MKTVLSVVFIELASLISARSSEDALRIMLDTNWVQPYVLSGNTQEIGARIVLDGRDLDRDAYVSDLPLTLTVSNAPLSVVSNVVLVGRCALPDCQSQTKSYLINPSGGSCATNIFHFPWPVFVAKGAVEILTLTSSIKAGVSNASFCWGTTKDEGKYCIISGITNCWGWTNALVIRAGEGNDFVKTEVVANLGKPIPILLTASPKLKLTMGQEDTSGLVLGELTGAGRPFRRYTIAESTDLQTWYGHIHTVDGVVQADSNGVFKSEIRYLPSHQIPHRFFYAMEVPE